MNYWQVVYNHLREMGFSAELINDQCISPDDARQIVEIIQKKCPDNILEIGTFVGLSAGVIALSAPDAALTCVDPNLPIKLQSAEFGYHNNKGALEFARDMIGCLGKTANVITLEGFFSCFPSKGFATQIRKMDINFDSINIVGSRVSDFAPYDLIFIDGDHFADSVYSDLSLVYKFLSVDGSIILHDLSDTWASEVKSGTEKFLQEHSQFSLWVKDNLGFLARENICLENFLV